MPGLNAKAGLLDWLTMWWRFWGIALPIALVGFALLARHGKRDKIGLEWRLGFFVGAAALFALANLVRFQPIPWDNSKLFLWVYLALCALIANLMAHLWRGRKPSRTHRSHRPRLLPDDHRSSGADQPAADRP
jgi:phosphatidylserine synthase